VAIVVLSLAACSGTESGDALATPSSCDLASVAPNPSNGGTDSSTAPIVARMTSYAAISDGQTVELLVLRADGELTARSDGLVHRAELTLTDVGRVEQCIDDSGFLMLDDGFVGSEAGHRDGKLCAVADAPVLSITASGSSDVTRTANGSAPGFADGGCDHGYPDGLLHVHAALEQLRDAAAT
jgi:hypothetical protein